MSGKSKFDPDLRKLVAELRKRIGSDGLHVIEELGDGTNPAAEVLLLHLLDDPAWNVRQTAVETLGRLGGVIARVAVRAATGDVEPGIRNVAADVLGLIGNRRDLPWLMRALRDSSWDVRASAAWSLGVIGGAKAKQSLLKALGTDPNPTVRRWAASGLSELGDRSAAPLLEEALAREADRQVQAGLIHALYRLGERPIEALLRLLQDDDALLRSQMLDGLDEDVLPADRKRVLEAIRQYLKTERDPGMRGKAERVLHNLQETLGSIPSAAGSPSIAAIDRTA